MREDRKVFFRKRKQAQDEKDSRQRASDEMHMKTVMQGRKMVYEHIKRYVDTNTPETLRTLSGIVCPQWYYAMWLRLLGAMLFCTKGLWTVLSYIGLLPAMKYLAKLLMRGGHIARISQGGNEWTVTIKIVKWWRRQVYKCDFDIRNGRVFEVVDTTKGN